MWVCWTSRIISWFLLLVVEQTRGCKATLPGFVHSVEFCSNAHKWHLWVYIRWDYIGRGIGLVCGHRSLPNCLLSQKSKLRKIDSGVLSGLNEQRDNYAIAIFGWSQGLVQLLSLKVMQPVIQDVLFFTLFGISLISKNTGL